MKPDEIKKLIKKEFEAFEKERLFDIPYHAHTGTDAPQINPKDLAGFPGIEVADVTVAPTDTPANVTFRFYYDATPDYRLWAYINQNWVSIPLGVTIVNSLNTLVGDVTLAAGAGITLTPVGNTITISSP